MPDAWQEVEVAPFLHDGVVHRAVGGLAIGAREAATGLEVNLNIEALVVDIEPARLNHPRRHQVECQLKQIDITHGETPRTRLHRFCHRARGRQGVAWQHCANIAACVPANLDRHSTRRRTGCAAGMEECSRRGPNQRMTYRE